MDVLVVALIILGSTIFFIGILLLIFIQGIYKKKKKRENSKYNRSTMGGDVAPNKWIERGFYYNTSSKSENEVSQNPKNHSLPTEYK